VRKSPENVTNLTENPSKLVCFKKFDQNRPDWHPLIMRNARASFVVLLVFSWDGINVIFLIQKLHLCHPKWYRCNFLITFMPCQENTKRTPEDVLAFLLNYIKAKTFSPMTLDLATSFHTIFPLLINFLSFLGYLNCQSFPLLSHVWPSTCSCFVPTSISIGLTPSWIVMAIVIIS